MHDTDGVRRRDRGSDLQHEIDRLHDCERSFLFQPPSEIAALEEFDDLKWIPIIKYNDVENAGDMLTLYVRRRPGFADEASDGIRVLQYFRLRKFDGDSRIQEDMLSRPNDTHTPATELSLDAISSIENVAFIHV